MRQLADALARRGKYGVGHRRRYRRNAGFARAAGTFRARHDVRFHRGHFVDAQHVVGVEVCLLHAAAIDGDFAFQRGGKPEGDASRDLLAQDQRIDDLAAVEGANHAMHAQLAIRHRNFGDLCVEAAHIAAERHALKSAGRQRFTPTGFFRGQIQDAEQSRSVFQQDACGAPPPDLSFPPRPFHRENSPAKKVFWYAPGARQKATGTVVSAAR